MPALRSNARTWLVPALACLSACVASPLEESSSLRGAGAGGSEAGANGAAAAGPGGESGAAGSGGLVAGGYRVTLHAAATSLCPGQCTEISAEAEHGREPYAYAWAGDVGDGPGPHRVCPRETTTYTVSATDTRIENEEFSQPSQSASASLAIQVSKGGECTLDGGAPIDRVSCSIELPYADIDGSPLLASLANGSSLATGAAGELYFAGTYTAQIDLGDGLNEDILTRAVFVAKYDAGCNLAWARRFVMDGPYNVTFNSIAVGPNGQLVAGGWLLGTVQFDEHAAVITGDGPTGLVLVSFDAEDGAVQWARADHTTFDGGGGTYQVAFDSAGDIVLSGWGSRTQTVDGYPVANNFNGPFIAKLSPDGSQYRFSDVMGGAELLARIAVAADGRIAMSTLSRENVVSYRGTALEYGGLWHRNLALLDSEGALLWNRDLDADLNEFNSEVGIGAIAFDGAGEVIVEHGDYVLESGLAVAKRLTKHDAMGTVLWSQEVSPPGWQKVPFNQGTFRLDPHDNIVLTDQIDNTIDSGDDAGLRAENKSPSDIIVRKLAPDGVQLWQHVFDTDVFEMVWGLAIGPDDSIWVGHGRDADANPYSGSLRITKLAP